MRRWAVAPWLAWIVFAISVAGAVLAADPQADGDAGAVKRAAGQFGQALTEADLSRLGELLPSRGKVRMQLVCLGPEQGSYSGSQVVALLQDFLRQGQVSSFRFVRGSETDASGFARVHATARLNDGEGKPHEVDLHLSFQQEDGRWVLRGIREAPR